ncbi:MAG TPA: hypothetical protein VHM02_06635, partial [Thermoanaerobaculia bacterium]|nr:hypothetical protein [Thermoanaerobaculia bacterium]
MDEYEGSEVQLRSEPALPPQIDQLSQFIETRDNGKVDALVIAVGINDFGFGELVMDCLSIEPPPPPPLPPF